MICLAEKKLIGISFIRMKEILNFHWDLRDMSKICFDL